MASSTRASAFIAGRFVRGTGATRELVRRNPGRTTEVVSRLPVWPGAVEEAVAAARAAQPAWGAMSQGARAAVLRRFAHLTTTDAEPLARLITRESGKPLWEARTEVSLAVRKVEVTLGAGLGRVRPLEGGAGAACRFRPRGVVAVLGPFNFPLHLPNGHIVPALATGNAVVFKPSEAASTVALRHARLLHSAGCPRGVINVVVGGARVGRRLALHPEVDAVLFTGSAAVGEGLSVALSQTPGKLVALEMGGKNAAVVLQDADLDLAVRECLLGAFLTTGQRCTSTSRIIVARSIAAPFLDAFVTGARRLTIGYGLDRGVFMGPLATRAGVVKFRHAQKLAARDGNEALLQGRRVPCRWPGYYVGPAVHLVRKVNSRSRYQNEEIFGPDVAVYVVDNLEEAAALADATEYGLALSVFTRSRRKLEPFFRRCRVGVLNWNRATVGASAALPFGGQKRSGNDRPTALFAVDSCTYPVAMLTDGASRSGPVPPGFPEM